MRYFVGFLITIGLIILLIILLFGGSSNKSKVPSSTKRLIDYSSTDAEVSMLIDGPINANSEHQQIKITAARDNVVYEEIRGYEGNVTEMKQFDNNEAAFDVFLHALAHAGFTKGDTNATLKDEKGYCPLGRRYIFELRQNSQTLERFWTTSCDKPKTFLGNASLTIELFKRQVPDYENLSGDLLL